MNCYNQQSAIINKHCRKIKLMIIKESNSNMDWLKKFSNILNHSYAI